MSDDMPTGKLTPAGLRTQERSRQATIDSARAAREGAEKAGAAANAAAANAAKRGGSSSEFKATMFAIAVSAAMGALDVLSHVPGPWQVTAAVIVGAATAAGVYTAGRSKVKAAALSALPATVEAQSGAVYIGDGS
jgi:hypothetical protein